MLRGLYTAASSMMAQTTRMDVVANNLANADTTGYKKDTTVTEAFPTMLIKRINDPYKDTPYTTVDPRPRIGTLGTGALISDVVTQQYAGSIKQTGNKLDFAIEGNGFFTIQEGNNIRYTRNGTFTLNNQNQLVTENGSPVLGDNNQPIVITGSDVEVNEKGEIFSNGQRVNALRITDFNNLQGLRKIGNSTFAPLSPNTQPRVATNFTVRQGALESSNVNVVKEMVEMITVSRSYEASQKVIQNQDEMLGKAVNEVGKLA